MAQRIMLGAMTLAIILALITIDVGVAHRMSAAEGPFAQLFRRGNILPMVVLLLTVIASFELSSLLKMQGARPFSKFAYLMVAALMLSPWLSAAGWLGQQAEQLEGLYWQVIWITLTIVGAGMLAVMRGDPQGVTRDFGATLLIVLYVGFCTSFAMQIRCGRDGRGQEGAWLLLISIFVTKASDIGAYLVGTKFGRTRLTPRISPGKSVEGTIGGLIASALVGALAAWAAQRSATWSLLPHEVSEGGAVTEGLLALLAEATRSFGAAPNPGAMNPILRGGIFGLILSTVGQFGDLLESCFKREAGAKDSGNILPKYGGILDLIDSPILAMPVAWFLLTYVWNVV